MKRIFFILVVCVQYSYAQVSKERISRLEQYINNDFFERIITSETVHDSICGITNFTDKSYTNDSIGINRFIALTLCASAHLTVQDKYEAYFGTPIVNKLNIEEPYIIYPQFKLLNEDQRFLYINTGLGFLETHLNELNKHNEYIKTFGIYVTLFYMTLQDIRENKYDNVDNYISILGKLYNYIVADDYLMADMVLDVIRRSQTCNALLFLRNKVFLSDDFNSQAFIHTYDSIGDKNYVNYIRKISTPTGASVPKDHW